MARDDERLARAARALRKPQGFASATLLRPADRDISACNWKRVRLRGSALATSAIISLVWVRQSASPPGGTARLSIDCSTSNLPSVVEATITEPVRNDWRTATEVTFSEWGERGSIDVLGAHVSSTAVVVAEAKSEWGSLEETIRALDAKARLAPVVAEQRFGFVPERVGVLLVFPEDRTARRIAGRYDATLGTALPARNREIRTWLRRPEGPLRGLWFLPNGHGHGPPGRPRT